MGVWNTLEYGVWQAMIHRCTNPRNPQFKDYGGRGITVCERWRKYVNFSRDMGPRPLGLTLDRINNDGNYEPGNCRWATRSEQQRNSRPYLRNNFICGHPKSDTNTYWQKDDTCVSGKSRICRTCALASMKRWRMRKRAIA
jgi:hypothetical protein